MSNIFKGLLSGSVLLILIGLSACSTSERITATGTGNSNQMYPSWFVPAGFESDSLAFHGYATAVSSDSVIAMANAELQARVNLESHIAEQFEDKRKSLEESGSSIAGNTDFIITLRNAHNAVQEAAKARNKSAGKEEGYYRGFAQVSISRSELQDLMRSGFAGKASYWEALKEH